jgi:hypothetical protein
VQKKKQEQSTTVLDAVSDAVLGQPDEGLTLRETYARRLSNTVLSGEWWKEQLQIEDGSGKPGAADAWEFRVYFDPDGGDGTLKLNDHAGDAQAQADALRARARAKYKARHLTDDLYSGHGSVPLAYDGGRPNFTAVDGWGTVHEVEHPPLPTFAPDDLLAELPSAAEMRREKRRQARAQLKQYSFNSAAPGQTTTTDASSAKGDKASQAVNPKLRAVFTRFSQGRSKVKILDLKAMAQKGLGVYLSAKQLAQMGRIVHQESDKGDIDFKLFQILISPYLD